jgi:hypothetical protein
MKRDKKVRTLGWAMGFKKHKYIELQDGTGYSGLK